VFLWGLTHHARVRMYHCSACGFASAYAAGTDVDRLHNPVSFCRDVRIGIWVVVRSVDVRYAPVLVQYQSFFFLAKMQTSQLNRAVQVPSTHPTTLNESALVPSPCSAEEAGEFALPEYISSSSIYTRRLIHERSSIHCQYTRDPGRIYTIRPIQNIPFRDSQLLPSFFLLHLLVHI
jgi:hypothetical protein